MNQQPENSNYEIIGTEVTWNPSNQDECDKIPDKNELDEWHQRENIYILSRDIKAKFNLSDTGLSTKSKLFVRESYRGARCKCRNGRIAVYGTSIQLIVSFDDIKFQNELSLAVLANETHLRKINTRSTLRVIGYKGYIELPPFRNFNIDTYVEISQEINKIKHKIQEDTENIIPRKLFLLPQDTMESKFSLSESLDFIWGLTNIAKGISCSQTKNLYPHTLTESVEKNIELSYIETGAEENFDNNKPTKLQQDKARELLKGLRLRRRHWFEG